MTFQFWVATTQFKYMHFEILRQMFCVNVLEYNIKRRNRRNTLKFSNSKETEIEQLNEEMNLTIFTTLLIDPKLNFFFSNGEMTHITEQFTHDRRHFYFNNVTHTHKKKPTFIQNLGQTKVLMR